MSRQTYDPKQTYVGTGSLATYSFDFKITSKSQLLVVVVNVAGIEVFRVSGADTTFLSLVTIGANGGSVTLAANLPAGAKLALIQNDDEPTQISEFANKKTFDTRFLEAAFDWISGPVQALALKAKRAFKIHETDDENTFDATFPPGMTDPANAKRTFAINPTSNGLILGPTTDTIDGAVASAAAALAAAAAAEDSAELAVESAESAAVSEANTTFYANLFLFDEFIQVDDTDSPVSATNDGSLYLADDSDGSITFNLPALNTVDENWKIAIIKQSPSANVLNVNPVGADTIVNSPTFVANERGIGVVFFKETPTNWGARYFAFTESTGINPLPPGGDTGAVLVKNSPTDFDVEFDDMEFEGYSARFNTNWYSKGLRSTIEMILNLTYLGPLIASFSGSSNILREKGASVSNITLTVDVTKRSNPIARIRFLQGATVIADNNPPAQTGSGTTSNLYATAFSDTRTFTVEVTDEVVGGDGGAVVTSNVTYNFVYPYYDGAAVPGRTAAQVAALNKRIITSNANINRAFTTVDGDVYYFAYPASYGNLVSILDENGFENISSFTKRVENITGLDGNAVSYNIYESNNPVLAGSTNFTFKR